MDITYIIDLNSIEKNEVDKYAFVIEKYSEIHETILLVDDDHQSILVDLKHNEKIKILESFEQIKQISINQDKWFIFFSNNNLEIKQDKNIFYVPLNLKGDLSQFRNKSFTEHAKNKKYYHDFSKYYNLLI